MTARDTRGRGSVPVSCPAPPVQVARLMRQQLQFLRQVNAMMEAKVLEEQLRAVEGEGAAA